MKLNLIMPMGGGGTRFGKKGFEIPKPLIEIYGKPFFYWATQSVVKFVDIDSLTYVILQEHVDRFKLDQKIRELYPNANIVVIPHILKGAVLTCKEGVSKLDNEAPILFNDCDHLFISSEFNEFCNKNKFLQIDGGLLTFKSQEDKFSYVSYDQNGNVSRTVEKQVISNDAICGAYYFRNKQVFLGAVERYLRNCSYNEFYLSGVYNEMISQHELVKSFGTDVHISFGTPEEYEIAKQDNSYKELIM